MVSAPTFVLEVKQLTSQVKNIVTLMARNPVYQRKHLLFKGNLLKRPPVVWLIKLVSVMKWSHSELYIKKENNVMQCRSVFVFQTAVS